MVKTFLLRLVHLYVNLVILKNTDLRLLLQHVNAYKYFFVAGKYYDGGYLIDTPGRRSKEK